MTDHTAYFATEGAWRPLKPLEHPTGPVRCALYDTERGRLVTTSDDPDVAERLKPYYDALVSGIFDADDFDACGYHEGRFVLYDTVSALHELGELAYSVRAVDEVWVTTVDLTRPVRPDAIAQGVLVGMLRPIVS